MSELDTGALSDQEVRESIEELELEEAFDNLDAGSLADLEALRQEAEFRGLP